MESKKQQFEKKLNQTLTLIDSKKTSLEELADLSEKKQRSFSSINFKTINKRLKEKNIVSIGNILSIGSIYANLLHNEGIRYIDELVSLDIDIFSRKTHIDENLLFKWRACAKLLQLPSMNVQLAEFLTSIGIFSIRQLANAQSEKIYELLKHQKKQLSKSSKCDISISHLNTVVYEANRNANTIRCIETINQQNVFRLDKYGSIISLEKLFLSDLETINKKTHISFEQLKRWKIFAGLMRIPNLYSFEAEILEKTGIDNVQTLAYSTMENIHHIFEHFIRHEDRRPLSIIPERKRIKEWIDAAKMLEE